MTELLQRIADYSQEVTVDGLDLALRLGGFYGVWHYLSGNYARRWEDPKVVIGIRARGWPQGGISVPRNPASVNGPVDADRAMNLYGLPRGSLYALDIEPGVFDLDPAGWERAANGWCDVVAMVGYVPVVYGVDRTVARCANHAQRIWRAKPGQADPEGPGLDPEFFAGRRMSQYDSEVWNGITFDGNECDFEFAPARDVSSDSSREDKDVEAIMYSPIDDSRTQTGPGILVTGGKFGFIPPASGSVDDTAELTRIGVPRAFISQALFDQITGGAEPPQF